MARLGTKQPYEEYYVAFGFAEDIGSASIATATVIAVDDADVDATAIVTTAANQNIASPDVNVWVKGGVDGKEYKITCRITTNSAPQEHYELDVTLPVAQK